jgi:DNA-binding transcriptional MerR regulator
MPINKNPAFNLKAVLQETGLAADTLRAWERRYGLPLPQRTAGGHRLYSQYDIEIIKWLIAHQADGLSISRAVDLWNEKITSGLDPLADTLDLPHPSRMNLENTRKEWLAACAKYDTQAAEQALNQAFAVHSVEIAGTEVVLRGLYEMGELWYQGKASVQQEHFASGIATRRVDALISATPPPTRSGTFLLACPQNEWHVIPMLLLTLFLRRRGWNVVHLGANVPSAQIEETIDLVRPRLVVLSAQTLITAVELLHMTRILHEKQIQTAFGGRVFNHISGLAALVPAHYLGHSLYESIPVMESLVGKPSDMPVEKAVDPRMPEMASEYKKHRPQIEAVLRNELNSNNPAIDHLDTAIHFLGTTMNASLELGHVSYLSTDISWLINLLTERHVSPVILPIFLGLYARATRQVMGEHGRLIADYLEVEAQKLKV